MDPQIKKFHEVAYFVGALAHGAETQLGRSSQSICFLAGKKFGLEAVAASATTSDPVAALAILQEALEQRGIHWEFEPFQGGKEALVEEVDGKKKMRLVFRTCMVRNALFRFAHEQKLSLCQMAHGVFAGALEKVLADSKVQLEILQAGPNACLKEVIWEEKS
jgi:hypothetical protein